MNRMDRPAADAIVLGPGEGRGYDMPTMRAVFKADGIESRGRFSVSEWWVAPQSAGPGAHSHADNDEIFYVVEGAAAILVGNTWINAEKGSFVMIPAGTVHDFENRTEYRMGLLNIFIPGTFEENMPKILAWYEQSGRA